LPRDDGKYLSPICNTPEETGPQNVSTKRRRSQTRRSNSRGDSRIVFADTIGLDGGDTKEARRSLLRGAADCVGAGGVGIALVSSPPFGADESAGRVDGQYAESYESE